MSTNQVNVNLLFQAETSSAINNIQQLSQLLNKIATKTTVGVDTGSLQGAVSAAQQLSIHLQNAVNVNTGKLNLSALNSSLKASGTTLNELVVKLQAAGPAGQQAFMKVANAVAQAEVPMIRVNARLKEFGVTMANTIKWQVASTAVHKMSSLFQSAVSHAEDLNVALNDIRIVTGYSSDTMSQFASRAAVAAKELNTTTTEYAKAALIFYQQGLSGDDVSKRADTVVKLSQVTGQSAEQVSSQMTAIWNNFDDGSHSLEYYADGLTKLGAATAASTDQIADGLEKFAAVADTVGLSYEYAAASVATVVDKTQQSAEVVGTSFKTIFARMQGLELGETLEDGVDLNKYSQALSSVGVEVLNAKGELRDMDDILDDLGEKWNGFGESTRVAIAQTVGGIRQYNQMISLMDNWDSVKKNIDLATQATGELTAQQKIWSESYTAASERVKRAQQEIYESFIDDEGITKLTDLFAALLESVGGFIDGIGGVVPLVLSLAGVFSKILFPLIQSGFTKLMSNISVLTGKASRETQMMQQNMQNKINESLSENNLTQGQKEQLQISNKLLAAKQQLAIASKKMSVSQQQEAEMAMKTYESLAALTQQTLEHKVALEQQLQAQKMQMNSGSGKKEMGEIAALTQFRQNNEGRDESEVDSIVDQATSTSRAATKEQLLNLDKESVDIAARKATIQEEIRRTEQSINDLNASFGQTSANNEERLQRILEKESKQQEKLAELKRQLEELPESDAERRRELEEILKLQEQIIQTSQGDVEDMVVGKASTTAFDDNLFGRGSSSNVGKMETAMVKDIQSELGATQDDFGNFTVDASLGNLEKLYNLMGQYKAQVAELAAIEKDFNTVSQARQKVTAKLIQSQKNEEAAAKRVKKAQQDYNNAIKEHGKNSKQAKSAKRELIQAEQNLAKATEQTTKVAKQNEVATQSQIKVFQGSEKRILELAKAAGATEQEMLELKKSFDGLKNGNSEAAIKNITSKLNELKIATSDVDGSLDLLAASMRESLLSAGVNPQQLEGLISTLEQLGMISPEVANQMRLLGAAGDEAGNKFSQTQGKFMSIAQGVAQAAGNISMAIGAIKSMISAFDEGNTPLETFSSLMMGLSMLLPIIIGATTKLAASEAVATAQKKISVALDANRLKLATAEGASKAMLTLKTWAQTAAEVALKIAQNPALGAVILAGIAAAIVAMGVYTNKTKEATAATEEKNKADIESAEAASELSSKWAEQMGAMDDLIAKYKSLKQAGEDYTETVDDIIEQVPELLAAYADTAKGLGLDTSEDSDYADAASRLENASSAAKTATDPEDIEKNINEINQAQNELDNMISEAAAEQAQAGATAAMNTMANSIVAKGDAEIKNGAVVRHVGGWNSINGTEESESVDILEKAGLGTVDGTGAGIDVSLDMSDSSKFLEDYEALQAAAEQIKSDVGTKNNDTYREVQEILDASKEDYEKLKEMQAEADKYGVFKAKSDLEAEGKDITDINSLKEYQEYKDALLNNDNVKGDPAAEEAAEQWLEAQGALSEYAEAENKIGYIGDKVKEREMAGGLDEEAAQKKADEAEKALQAMYDNLSEEEQKLFIDVDVNKYQSEEAIKAELTRLQGIANENEIQAKITAIEDVESNLQEDGMTEEDWIAIRDSEIGWGKEGVMEFTEFLDMSYEAQSEYLNKIKSEQQEALVNESQNTINELQSKLAELEQQKADGTYSGTDDQYNTETEAIQTNIDLLNEELAIREKIANAQEAERFGVDPEIVEDVKDAFLDMAEAGEDGYESLEGNEEAAQDAALRYVRLQEAVKDLCDNYEDYDQVLTDVQKSTSKADKAMAANSESGQKLKKSLAGLLGTTEDLISTDLLDAIDPKDFEKAAKGDEAAIGRIRDSFIQLEADAAGIDFSGLKNELDGLAEGATLGGLDQTAFLSDLITAKLNAGATATDIKNTLSGFGIDMDNITFYDDLASAQAAAAETGGMIVDDLSFSQETTTEATEVEKNGTVGEFTETINKNVITDTNYVTETDESGNITSTPVESQVVAYTKTVNEGEQPTTSSETVTNTETKTTNGAGKTGSAPPKKYAVVTGRKSVGGSVGTPTTNHTSGNGSGGGGGGGGGGSDSKPAKPIKKTHKSDVVERYKKINDAIDDMTDALEKANMETDRMFGQARIKGMQKVNELTRQEIGLLKQKADEARKYKDDDKAELQQVADEYELGKFEFDKKGNITNYESQMNKLYEELRAAENHQDSLSTEEEQNDYQDTVDKINDKIDAVKEAMERYEESREELEELEKQIREKEIEIEDRELEIFVYEVELKINVDQHELDYLEYLLEEMENLAFKSADRINEIFANQATAYENQAKTTRKAIRDLLKENGLTKEELKLFDQGKFDEIDWSKYTENFTQAEMDQLEEWTQNLLDQNSSLMEMRRLVHEEVMVAFEEWNEELDRNMGYIEHYGTMVDHLQNIADLTKTFTGTDAKFLDDIAKAKVGVAQDKAASAKATYDANVASLEAAEDAFAQAKKDYKAGKISEEELKMWEDTVHQMQEAVYESEDELYSAVSEVVEAAAERYEQAMDQAFKTFEKQIAGQAGSLEELSNQMDRAKQTSEHYLKDYQKIYELTKLNRKITDSIDESSNVKAKQALRDLQKEINEYQKEGNEMSQYDLDYLQKKYDLKLAQIALEEAREAKNQVRLTRDAEGNYGYTYTADQENVDNAQQNYEDKLYELQSLSDNYLTELQDNILSTQQEYSDALREIYERQKEGYYESEAAFQEALAQVNEHYTGHLEYLYDEMDKACGNNAKLYESDWSTYNGFVSGKMQDNEDFITSFDETMLGMQTGFTDTETAMKTFKDAIGTATSDGKGTGLLGTMNKAFTSFKNSTTKALKNIGVEGLGTLKTDFKNKIGSDSKKDSILGKSNTAKNEILSDAKAMIGDKKKGTGILGVIASIQDWEAAHSKSIQNIINKNKLAVQAYNSLYKAAALGTEKKDDDDDKKDDEGKKPDNNNKDEEAKALAKEASDIITKVHKGQLGNRQEGWVPAARRSKYSEKAIDLALKAINDSVEGNGYNYCYKKALEIVGYDTGGYTGEWGPNGKLALLHEKELVLNKEDTANILTTVGMVRELSDILDIYAKQAAFGLQMLQMSTSLQSIGQELQQEVTIHAEFPNVSDRNEIQEAFDNLINRASQFAYRAK